MSYAIARFRKLTRGSFFNDALKSDHHAIAFDSDRNFYQNFDAATRKIRFIDGDPEKDLEELVLHIIRWRRPEQSQKIQQPKKIRVDAVFCIEFLLTASPNYFRPNNPAQCGYYETQKLEAWFALNKEWLEKQYGKYIVRAELCLNKATPHICAYFVPWDEKGQLRCNHFTSVRQNLRDFQNSYFEVMQRLGLKRGTNSSRSDDQNINDFYLIVEKGIDLVPIYPSLQQDGQYDECSIKDLIKENRKLKQRIKELEVENYNWKQLMSG